MIRQKVNVLATAQSVSGGWANLGCEQNTEYKRTFAVFLDLTINDSENVRIRACGRYEEGGDNYFFPIRVVTTNKVAVQDEYIELADDANQKMILSFSTDKVIPIVQVQVSAGTAGATPATVTARTTVGNYN